MEGRHLPCQSQQQQHHVAAQLLRQLVLQAPLGSRNALGGQIEGSANMLTGACHLGPTMMQCQMRMNCSNACCHGLDCTHLMTVGQQQRFSPCLEHGPRHNKRFEHAWHTCNFELQPTVHLQGPAV